MITLSGIIGMARVAVVQMVSSEHVSDNLALLDRFFLTARDNGAELIALPENFAFMGRHDKDKLNIAEIMGQGDIQGKVSQLAKRYGLWVIAGSIPIQFNAQRVKASCIVYDAQGLLAARYDKIHLFDVAIADQEPHHESLTIERGANKLVVVDTPVGRVGLSVCYDLRFPELYQQLVRSGAELLSVPSSFTAFTGEAHWNILLRARAIENLSYVLAPNQGGRHSNGRHTYGHSMVVEPWGNIISELEKDAGVIMADIDLTRLRQLRRQFPCNDHHVLNTSI
jgi:nitrilase